ncbi:MAG: tRNA isopentenyl-2-thiomethyl-A-37 hydroxylase MiaE [Verrucomicrobiales bacterium]
MECRKKLQADERINFEYHRLLEKEEKSWQDYYDLAITALDLYELGRLKRLEKVRSFLNKIPDTEDHRIRVRDLKHRIHGAEQGLR